jgi:CheY-like chemotaxis protein
MLPSGVRLHVQGDTTTWVRAEQGQVEHLVVNLVANARDALGSSGEIWVDLSSKWLDKSELPADGRLDPGCYAVLRVRDTGAGIPADVLPRIFDPFFTTKPAGVGTGLGLAASRDLICAAGGDVMVASRPGHGTCFKILLPEKGAAPRQQALESLPIQARRLRSAAGPGTPAGGIKVWASEPSSGTFVQERCVLVVDDQPELLRSTSRTLKRAGHDVLTASDAELAMELVLANPERIGTLVTDVNLPGQSGPELAHSLREKCRELAVVFVTGTADATDIDSEGARAVVVKKPFRGEELVSAVATARSLVPRVA